MTVNPQLQAAVVWDAKTGAELLTLRHPARLTQALFSPDGTRIATSTFHPTPGRPDEAGWGPAQIRVWDAKSGAELYSLPPPRVHVRATWSPDGSQLATGDANGQVRVWDAKTGDELLLLLSFRRDLRAERVEFSPNGAQLIVAYSDAASGGPPRGCRSRPSI
jgi:WD40 repeat protein